MRGSPSKGTRRTRPCEGHEDAFDNRFSTGGEKNPLPELANEQRWKNRKRRTTLRGVGGRGEAIQGKQAGSRHGAAWMESRMTRASSWQGFSRPKITKEWHLTEGSGTCLPDPQPISTGEFEVRCSPPLDRSGINHGLGRDPRPPLPQEQRLIGAGLRRTCSPSLDLPEGNRSPGRQPGLLLAAGTSTRRHSGFLLR